MKNSELVRLHEKFIKDVDVLRKRCSHQKTMLTIKFDHSVVGCGSAFPSIHVICINCGKTKIMFRSYKEMEMGKRLKIQLTLKRQLGIEDQRLDCVSNECVVKYLIRYS